MTSSRAMTVTGWRREVWTSHGERISVEAHLRAEREVRLGRRLRAESWVERLTR